MVKKVAIVALDPRASEFYGNQVQELFGDYVEVNSYSVKARTIVDMVRSDLYLMSTDAFDNREDVPQYIPIDAQISEIHVSYFREVIEELKALPSGTRALFVNLTEKMVREATTTLNQLGINHIQFIPFYPGAKLSEDIDLAITPDEERYVPRQVKQVLNIGHRCCTSETMIEAALKLGLDELLETRKFKDYISSVVTSTYNFDLMFARSRRLESQFEILMEILDVGIVGINELAEIFAVNKKAEEITGLARNQILQKPASAVFSYLPFSQCLSTKETTQPKVIRIQGINVVVSIAPVLRQDDCIGAFATLQRFNDAENKQQELRNQLMHKGYRAKYTFHDVLGNSEGIVRTRQILARMAMTESPVLLIGETGTGKELFAHAVHRASRRDKEAFVAINCAAVPENLLESELFGYEEGAFTGAKKGGRLGLFEYAHHGTLFLDEVEGMSQALQVKLLRVLQEHEIMRVGGNRIISVDVRIIAATNESLEEKVRDGSFRRDLYYRLNTLPVLIPPLRQRGEDIFLLLEQFREEAGGCFVLSEEVRQMFRSYSWPGNIRELHNLAEYFTFTGSPVITLLDVPPTFLMENRPDKHVIPDLSESTDIPAKPHAMSTKRTSTPADSDQEPWEQAMACRHIERDEYRFILSVLHEYAEKMEIVGRDKIALRARESGLMLSQIKIRTAIDIMKEYGLAVGSRGRGGSRITQLGKSVVNQWSAYEESHSN